MLFSTISYLFASILLLSAGSAAPIDDVDVPIDDLSDIPEGTYQVLAFSDYECVGDQLYNSGYRGDTYDMSCTKLSETDTYGRAISVAGTLPSGGAFCGYSTSDACEGDALVKLGPAYNMTLANRPSTCIYDGSAEDQNAPNPALYESFKIVLNGQC